MYLSPSGMVGALPRLRRGLWLYLLRKSPPVSRPPSLPYSWYLYQASTVRCCLFLVPLGGCFGVVEVAGSNPVTQTKKTQTVLVAVCVFFFLCDLMRTCLRSKCRYTFTSRRSGSSLTRRRECESSPQANTLSLRPSSQSSLPHGLVAFLFECRVNLFAKQMQVHMPKASRSEA